LLRTLEGHADDVLCLAASNDGRHLASGSADRLIKIWDLSFLEDKARRP
jgi:WD40 repeat protein